MIGLKPSEEDFQELYRNQYGGIRRTLMGMTGNPSIAEELTQEAFLKAWRGLPLFSFKSSLKTWLYQVAINVGRDWLRSHKSAKDPLHVPMEEKSPEARAIDEALLELEEETRILLLLHYYEGLKQKEMASVLGIPEGTVKSRLHKAKLQLQELLLKRGYDV